jgi:hypothetical protein
MKRTSKISLLCALPLLCLAVPAFAQFDEGGFRQALKVKKEVYLTEGSFSGGDRASSDYRITQVRIAANPAGYDRIVIDLSGNTMGEKSTLSRPPFYMVELDPSNHKVNVTLYGKPKLDFSTQTAIQSARKTKTISKLDFVPLVNSDRWTWSIQSQAAVKAEVFELTDPARIIIDLKKSL